MQQVLSVTVTALIIAASPLSAQVGFPLRDLPYAPAEDPVPPGRFDPQLQLDIMGLPALGGSQLPDEAREVRIWVSGPGPTLPYSFLRLTAFAGEIVGELVIHWEEGGEPFVDDGRHDDFEHALAAAGARSACTWGPTGRFYSAPGPAGSRVQRPTWIAACHFGDMPVEGGWAGILASLDGSDVSTLASRAQPTSDGVSIPFPDDGTFMFGESLTGSVFHRFWQPDPRGGAEPNASRATHVAEVVLQLKCDLMQRLLGPLIENGAYWCIREA